MNPPRQRYSRLLVPRKSGDDAVLGLLALHGPLGFEDADRDLVAFFREAPAARAAADALRARKVQHTLTTDIAEGDPLEAYRAASQPFAVGRRLWMEPGEPPGPEAPPGRIALRVPASRKNATRSRCASSNPRGPCSASRPSTASSPDFRGTRRRL